MISLEDYFGTYWDHPDKTEEVVRNAMDLLRKCNALYCMAELDGCELPINPKTWTGVSGKTDGGFRPGDSTTGATNSTHKTGQGVDRYDPNRRLAAWILAHPESLKKCDLYMEDCRWTVTLDKDKKVVGGWLHLQSIPPRSKKRVYIPNANAPLADYPEPWK